MFQAHSDQDLPSWALYKAAEALVITLGFIIQSEKPLHNSSLNEWIGNPLLLVNYPEGNYAKMETSHINDAAATSRFQTKANKDDDIGKTFSHHKISDTAMKYADSLRHFFMKQVDSAGTDKKTPSHLHVDLEGEKKDGGNSQR